MLANNTTGFRLESCARCGLTFAFACRTLRPCMCHGRKDIRHFQNLQPVTFPPLITGLFFRVGCWSNWTDCNAAAGDTGRCVSAAGKRPHRMSQISCAQIKHALKISPGGVHSRRLQCRQSHARSPPRSLLRNARSQHCEGNPPPPLDSTFPSLKIALRSSNQMCRSTRWTWASTTSALMKCRRGTSGPSRCVFAIRHGAPPHPPPSPPVLPARYIKLRLH
jgi:hypothetical protein